MSEPILKAEHLGITFGGLKAVSDFNMTINSGELIGLIGPNGAGKTTVFNLLTGVYQPTEGEFFLDGERMNGKKTYQVVRAGIARTFQNIRLFGQMTVEENVLVAFNESFSYHMGGAISARRNSGSRNARCTPKPSTCSRSSDWKVWRKQKPRICRTAPSASWKSHAPSPPA